LEKKLTPPSFASHDTLIDIKDSFVGYVIHSKIMLRGIQKKPINSLGVPTLI